MVPGQDCMEDGRMCPNGIHHAEGLCQPGGMWACIVMDQNNATWEFASAAVLNSLTKTSKCSTVGISIDGCVDEDLQHAVMDWLNSQAAVWYEKGISKLVSRYKCLNVQGDYVEK